MRYASGPNAGGEATHVELEHVNLKVGSAEVPLRSTLLRKGGAAPVSYTHLDVYKRQLMAMPMPSVSAAGKNVVQ